MNKSDPPPCATCPDATPANLCSLPPPPRIGHRPMGIALFLHHVCAMWLCVSVDVSLCACAQPPLDSMLKSRLTPACIRHLLNLPSLSLSLPAGPSPVSITGSRPVPRAHRRQTVGDTVAFSLKVAENKQRGQGQQTADRQGKTLGKREGGREIERVALPSVRLPVNFVF